MKKIFFNFISKRTLESHMFLLTTVMARSLMVVQFSSELHLQLIKKKKQNISDAPRQHYRLPDTNNNMIICIYLKTQMTKNPKYRNNVHKERKLQLTIIK